MLISQFFHLVLGLVGIAFFIIAIFQAKPEFQIFRSISNSLRLRALVVLFGLLSIPVMLSLAITFFPSMSDILNGIAALSLVVFVIIMMSGGSGPVQFQIFTLFGVASLAYSGSISLDSLRILIVVCTVLSYWLFWMGRQSYFLWRAIHNSAIETK